MTRAAMFIRMAAHMNWVLCAIVYVVMLFEVESVLASGPIITVCGLILLTSAAFVWQWSLVWLGLSDLVICGLFYGGVKVFHWGPADAALPFRLAGAFYLIWLVLLIVRVHKTTPRFAPNQCSKCGYLLIGLPTPRCPECGTPFDPSAVTDRLDTES